MSDSVILRGPHNKRLEEDLRPARWSRPLSLDVRWQMRAQHSALKRPD